MALFTDPPAEGWTAEDVIYYEVALKEDYGLNCHIEPACTDDVGAHPRVRPELGVLDDEAAANWPCNAG